jgi:hypothetical protein
LPNNIKQKPAGTSSLFPVSTIEVLPDFLSQCSHPVVLQPSAPDFWASLVFITGTCISSFNQNFLQLFWKLFSFWAKLSNWTGELTEESTKTPEAILLPPPPDPEQPSIRKGIMINIFFIKFFL